MTEPDPPSLLPQIRVSDRDHADPLLALIDRSNAGRSQQHWDGFRFPDEKHLEAVPHPHARTGVTVADDGTELALRLLADAPTGGCALHFEAGAGELLPLIEERFDEVVAVDSSPLRVQWSRGRVKLCDDGRLPFPDGIFDFVCGSLDRAPRRRLRAYVAEAHRVLVPGGVLRLRAGPGCSNWRLLTTLGASPFEDFNPGAYSIQRRWVTAHKR